MFVYDAWYIAALGEELSSHAMLARTILGEPVLLHRGEDGAPIALLDRCPHRFAPLSMGTKSGEEIQCGYHGMTFDRKGECVGNPVCPGRRIPKSARVRSFAAVERHGLIWIWMSDSDRADPSEIPDYSPYDSSEWTARVHYMHVDANYLLIIDNLMDLSHIAFVHADILGNEDVRAQEESETLVNAKSVSEKRLVRDSRPIPVWQAVLGDSVGKVDLWMDIHWSMASNIMLDVGSTPTGQAREKGAGIWNLDCVTPETASTSHYFYGHARRYQRHDVAVTAFWSESMAYAFEQDKRMIEAVQQRMGSEWDLLALDPRPVTNPTDKAGLTVRKMISDAMTAEGPQAAKAVFS